MRLLKAKHISKLLIATRVLSAGEEELLIFVMRKVTVALRGSAITWESE